jgi:hypothetical protein
VVAATPQQPATRHDGRSVFETRYLDRFFLRV